jgi:uncharacterized membrane protein
VIGPDGDFGYVLDLARIAANEKMVVRGQPEASELYRLIRDDEMPGEDSESGPLTVLQKEVIRRWIELNAPPPSDASDFPVAAPAAEKKARSPWQRLYRLAGEFHSASVHFPIALFLFAAIANLMALNAACLFCIRFAALTAPMAAVLGWINADLASYTSKSAQILAWHRWLGTTVAILAIVAALLANRSKSRFRAVLIVGGVLVLIVGALGGGLSHGFSHYQF